MAEKFLAFKFQEGFANADGTVTKDSQAETPDNLNILGKGLFTDETAKAVGLNVNNETEIFKLPVTQQLQDEIAVLDPLVDTAPNVENTTEVTSALDYKKLGKDTDYLAYSYSGFYDVHGTVLKNREYTLDYATALNTDTYPKIVEQGGLSVDSEAYAAPISKAQMAEFAKMPILTQDFGFFHDSQREDPELGAHSNPSEIAANSVDIDKLVQTDKDNSQTL